MINTRPIFFSCILAAFSLAAAHGQDPTPSPATSAPATADADTLQIPGKESARGTFLGWDKDGIHWRGRGQKDPTLYALSDIAGVKLGAAAPSAGAQSPSYMVSLINGDELPATTIAFDGTTLSIDTLCAGKIAIPREKAASVTMYSNSILYASPSGADESKGLDGWVDSPLTAAGVAPGSKAWKYAGGEFFPTGSADGVIARDVGLTDKSRIEFDLVPGKRSSFGVNLYTGDHGAGCQLLFVFYTGNRASIQLDRYDPAATQKMTFLQQNASLTSAATKMHIDIRADRIAKKITLFVDDKLITRFTVPEMFTVADGRGMAFYTARNAAAHISNIKVSIWDGADATQKNSAPQVDSLEIANGDRVSGKLKTIADGKIDIESSLSEMTVPLDKIVRILFSGPPPAAPATPAAAIPDAPAYDPAAPVRATLVGGGSMTLQIDSWDEKQVNVTSPILGKMVFSPSIFSELKYLPNTSSLDLAPANAPALEPRRDLLK